MLPLAPQASASANSATSAGGNDLLLVVLRRLGRDGILLGITSGAVEAAAHIKLARAGFNRYFPFGGYGSDSADRVELTKKAIERGGLIVGHPLDPANVSTVVVALCADEATLRHLVTELARALSTGLDDAVPLQYADVAEWQRDLRDACLPHRDVLARGGAGTGGPTLIARIDALRAIVLRYPRLFVTTAP